MAKKEQVNWNSFTKAELIKTIRTLHVRQTKLLNRIAELETKRAPAMEDNPYAAGAAAQRYPWETQLANTVTYEPTNGKPNCRKENE